MDFLRPALYALGALATYLVARRWWSRAVMPSLSTAYAAHNHGGPRSLAHVNLIVLHSTEGASAKSTAEWFANPTPIAKGGPGSTHIVIDDLGGYRTLPDAVIPYGSGSQMKDQAIPVPNTTNDRGLHLEFSGHHDWTRAQWLQHDPMLRRGGQILAAWASQQNIALAMLGPQAVRDGIADGVTTHKTVSDAFGIVGGHQDPGPGFPLDVLLAYARGG